MEHEQMTVEGVCPRCGDDCGRDEVDIGIGIMRGPWGCGCGWSEWPEYDRRNPEVDRRTDTRGRYYPYKTS